MDEHTIPPPPYTPAYEAMIAAQAPPKDTPGCGSTIFLCLTLFIGGALALPWLSGLATRLWVWFGAWYTRYSDWAYDVARGVGL